MRPSAGRRIFSPANSEATLRQTVAVIPCALLICSNGTKLFLGGAHTPQAALAALSPTGTMLNAEDRQFPPGGKGLGGEHCRSAGGVHVGHSGQYIVRSRVEVGPFSFPRHDSVCMGGARGEEWEKTGWGAPAGLSTRASSFPTKSETTGTEAPGSYAGHRRQLVASAQLKPVSILFTRAVVVCVGGAEYSEASARGGCVTLGAFLLAIYTTSWTPYKKTLSRVSFSLPLGLGQRLLNRSSISLRLCSNPVSKRCQSNPNSGKIT